MRNILSFRAVSVQPQVLWLTFMQNVDRQIPWLFINTKQSLQTSLNNHIHHTSIHISFQIIHLYMWAI